MFGFPDSLVLLMLGLVVLGACYAFTVIPIMPEMIESVGSAYTGRESELNDRLSSIFHTSVGLGQIFGPLIGSTMTESFGFRTSCDLMALWMLAFTILYFVIVEGPKFFTLSWRRCRGKLPNRRDADAKKEDEEPSK